MKDFISSVGINYHYMLNERMNNAIRTHCDDAHVDKEFDFDQISQHGKAFYNLFAFVI